VKFRRVGFRFARETQRRARSRLLDMPARLGDHARVGKRTIAARR